MKWQAKRDADGQLIPRCCVTDSGYTVAERRMPRPRYPVTRPGSALPFAYVDNREQVVEVITNDLQANATSK